MPTVVKFKTPNFAERVREYFPDITEIEGEILTFSQFDHPAFRLVVALEGLERSDYTFIEEQRASPQPWEIAGANFRSRRRSAILEINIYTVRQPEIPLQLVWNDIPTLNDCRVERREFRLSVAAEIPSANTQEIPLTINSDLVAFAMFLGMLGDGNALIRTIIAEIESAFCEIDCRTSVCKYYLKMTRNGQTQTTRFYASDVTLNATYL